MKRIATEADAMTSADAVTGGGGPANTTSFDDLVTAATVGVARRPLRIEALDEPAARYAGVLDASDPAAALLDAAALAMAGRRAGLRPARGVACPAPATGDGAPELSARAARVLREVAATDVETLEDLLEVAGRAGYLAPAPLLPMLLDTAARAKALRPAIAAILGPRGRWLAAQRPQWRSLADTALGGGTAPGGLTAPGGGGGDLDLAAADEAALEKALDHRREAVRAAARRELARRPGSAFGQRAAQRAADALQLQRDGSRTWLAVVQVRRRLDQDAARDGIAARPAGPGISAFVWQLIQLVAAAPLPCWETTFGLDPSQIVALEVADDLGLAVHAGWRLAAIRQRNATWALALLEAGAPAGTRGQASIPLAADYELAAALPVEARAQRAAGLLAIAAARLGQPQPGALAVGDAKAAVIEVGGCPGPWPAVLADAFVAMLGRTVGATPRPGWPRELMLTAGRNLPAAGPVNYAAQLTQLADTPGCPAPWAAVLRRTAHTIALRRAFQEEIR